MKIISKKIDDLKPYRKNARINDDAVVDMVANSISAFGFRVPILIEKDGTIVAGHTRFKACKKLHIYEVPCIVIDDLTEEQVKAYRLADNKVSEKSEWDFSLLDEEINNIINIDMSDFGFEFESYIEPDKKEQTEKRNERVRTALGYNLNIYDSTATEGDWGIPCINGEDYVPSGLIGFNYVKTAKNFDAGVHFFIDDYQFERVWNQPEKYLEMLQMFDCVLTPDFSLYLDMPLVMQLWNTYRSRLLGKYWQDNGITVIPTVSWGDVSTYNFCFDGLPEKSTLAVSTVGILKSSDSIKIFKDGLHNLVLRKKPKQLIVYGRPIENYDFENIKTVHFSNSVTDRLATYRDRKVK